MKKRTVALLALLTLALVALVALAGCGGGDKVDRSQESYAALLYAAKNPYVENTSANNDLVKRMGVGSYGKYTLDVQDDDHPYTLSIRFMYLHSDTDLTTIDQKLNSVSALLLALIEDCEQVNWSYPSESGLATGYIGIDYANELFATDVKEAGKDEAAFTALCERLFPEKAAGGVQE